MSDGAITLPELRAKPLDLLGVSADRERALRDFGIANVLDVLTHYPLRYIDRTRQARIADLVVGDQATIVLRIDRVDAPPTRRGGKARVVARATDGTGRLSLVFFNQRWRAQQLKPGMEVVVFGKLDVYRGERQMANPVVDLIGDRTGRIVPVYPQSEKLRIQSWQLAGLVEKALAKCRVRGIADPVPMATLDRFDLIERHAAFSGIHNPESFAEREAARSRLVFDELLRVQLALVLRKRAVEQGVVGIAHQIDGVLVRRFHERLPYALTKAQARALDEIERDLASPVPMHRLLQGDVGAGKTVVAVSALLVAVQGGHQGALMAPTEVLAEQHYLGVRDLLDGMTVAAGDATLFADRPLTVALLTNRTSAGERARLAEGLARGDVDILIGTHALIQEGVAFRSLGAVVIDEQHRFGVEQRAALRAKGEGSGDGRVPDVLVMTATPIPRTAAMTVYGDLDVTTLDELPPGRTPIVTEWARGPLAEASVWEHVRREVAGGRQAYVVCPLIEESEKLEVASATETWERLSATELAGLRVGLLHGRLTPREKEATMAAFRAATLDVLVSTTVIEVGIDVPNASVMVVLDADRFGLAQLHQLRGRVGRGEHPSRCYVLGEPTTDNGEERLKGFEASNDGFYLAELDLDLRGEGTIMGERQSGRSDLKLASLRRDKEWVPRAREAAFEIVDADPRLAHNPLLADEVRLLIDDDEAEFLFKS